MTKKLGLLHDRFLTICRRNSFQSIAAHCATTKAAVFPDPISKGLIPGKKPVVQLQGDNDCYAQGAFFWRLIMVREK